MSRSFWTRYVAFLLVLQANGFLSGQEIEFNQSIRPLLSDRCFVCHGPDEAQRASDLRLDLREGLNQVVTPADADASELLRRIEARNESERMPPTHSNLSLSDSEIALLRRWVEQGAPWELHWSFAPILSPRPPQPHKKERVQNCIDQFVLARLEKEGLSFAPHADKAVLMRRVSLDLTGLAPTVKELDEFLSDNRPDAYERLVDRLLASPRFGERMASRWLDLARYSDTYGYQVDRDRFVWPWRDWVVRSFNSNQPFDQFATEQIAGDLLPNATDDQILATTFNRLHPQKVEGGSIEEEFRVEYVADRLHTFGTVFLGLTVECARCHDHKFDPLTMNEYYQLFAFFNQIDEAGLYSFFDPSAVPTPTLMLMNEAQKQKLAELEQKVETADQELVQLIDFLVSRDAVQTPVGSNFSEQANLKRGFEADFDQWLKDDRGRSQFAQSEQNRMTQIVPILAPMVGGNQLIVNQDDSTEIVFTGDDEVPITGGKFARDQPFSIAARLKIPATADGKPIDRAVLFHCSRAWTDSASRGYQLIIEDGKLSAALIHFWPGNAICVQTQERIPDGQWVDITLTYDGGSAAKGLKLYLNGEPLPTKTVRDHLTRTIWGTGTDRVSLSARFRDKGFKNGRVSRFQIFDTEFDPIEVRQLYDGQSLSSLLSARSNQIERDARSLGLLRQHYVSRHHVPVKRAREKLQQARKELYDFQDQQAEIMVMREVPGLRQTFKLARGAYDAPENPVNPATPEMLPPLKARDNVNPNRLDLAAWLVDKNNPLTARVAINQYWQMLFGTGLVRTPEDFGSQSIPPIHRELLDWLAADFQKDWNVKRTLKQMVMSSTYQQSSFVSDQARARDPENTLLSRAAVHRLPAEMIRDNFLFQGGVLVEQMSGPPVRPYDLELAFSPVERDRGEALYRRSLYTYWKRTSASPAMMVLDAPSRDVCKVNRDRTSSPLQGLLLLNGIQFVEAARQLAEVALKQTAGNPEQIAEFLFRSLTSRSAQPQEVKVLTRLFEVQEQRYRAQPELAESLIAVGDSKSQFEDKVELAAWTTVVNMLMNLEEATFRH
jgi:hypothetical protein